MDLDDLFNDMLGDLAVISQQLEDTAKADTEAKPVKHTPSVIPVNTITTDTLIDADLDAMLSDLTDWEQNLTGTGAPSSSSGSKASVGDDYQQSAGDLHSASSFDMLHVVDAAPQFNTLKRSAAGARTVTYEDEDTLEHLDRDLEVDKRNQDKARQLSAEELATLSPVMQELDDLVKDLSNMEFFQTSYPTEDMFSTTTQPKSKTPTTTTNNNNNAFDYSKNQPEKTGTLPERRPSMPESSNAASIRRNSAKDSYPPKVSIDSTHQVLRQSLEDLRKSKPVSNKPKPPPKPPVSSKPHLPKKPQEFPPRPSKPKPSSPPQTITRQGSVKGYEIFPPPPSLQRQGSAKALENFTPPSPQQEFPPRPPKPKPASPSQTIIRQASAKRPDMFSPPPSAQRQGSFNAYHNFPPPFQRQGSAKTPETASPPPLFQRQGSIKSFENIPSTAIKRQGSAKAPENLINILERQLQQRSAQNDRRSSRTSTSSEANSEPVPDHHPPSFNHHLHQQNVSEATPHPVVPISKHSSMASVVSSLSASSVTSTKSNSSAESGSMSVDQTHHSMEHANEKHVPVADDIRHLMNALQHKQKDKDISPEERDERIKNEKMRIALEKLKEARIQKLVVKVFNKDDSSKTLLVDERMTARSVISQLLEKNHYDKSVNWALVEELPSLYMERIFEEHECVTEMLSYWTRDTSNQVRFLERKDKYALFRNPQHYLLSVSDSEKQLAERQKQTLIDEFFSGRSGTGVPEVQGILYIKAESKSWAKKYCVLRSSGLYFSKSGEPKKGKKLADLQCLVMFEQVCVYLGRGWKKKYKSPTDYGFSLKHPAIQMKSKRIKYFCCDDVRSLMRWIVGIRCAKYGKQLKENYDRTEAEMKAQAVTTPVATSHTQKDESSSSEPSDVPRASITNVFGAAWQRANQEETPNTGGEITRTKSVWNSSNTKSSSSNWWDLGAGPELKGLAEETLSGGAKKRGSNSDLPPPQLISSTNSARPGPPPPAIYTPSRPGPPPLPSKKPTTMVQHDRNKFPTPPPPTDDIPPPPPLHDMPPPPPPMDDMPPPPPPMDEEMPLPPPMPLTGGPPPPRLSGNPGGPSPGRLPMLPMFKNGHNLSKQPPPKRPGPPPPSRNSNASNNKAAYKPEATSGTRHKQQPTSPPRPPLTTYYTNTIKSSSAIPFAASDLPPAPEFVTDLRDTFYSMSNGLCPSADNLDDFPPPPPELLLNEVKSRKNQQYVNKKNMKSAPPPPRRSEFTKLSFKRA